MSTQMAWFTRLVHKHGWEGWSWRGLREMFVFRSNSTGNVRFLWFRMLLNTWYLKYSNVKKWEKRSETLVNNLNFADPMQNVQQEWAWHEMGQCSWRPFADNLSNLCWQDYLLNGGTVFRNKCVLHKLNLFPDSQIVTYESANMSYWYIHPSTNILSPACFDEVEILYQTPAAVIVVQSVPLHGFSRA